MSTVFIIEFTFLVNMFRHLHFFRLGCVSFVASQLSLLVFMTSPKLDKIIGYV